MQRLAALLENIKIEIFASLGYDELFRLAEADVFPNEFKEKVFRRCDERYLESLRAAARQDAGCKEAQAAKVFHICA